MGYARPMARVARALGSLDDPTADDYDVETVNDPRTDYLAWAAAVKQFGGVVTTMPHVNAGAAAARYPFDVIYPPPGDALNPIFKRSPDDWSDDSAYGYYRAPASVLVYTMGGMKRPQAVPGEPAPANPVWYENVLKYLKYAGYAAAALVALEALSLLPRRR